MEKESEINFVAFLWIVWGQKWLVLTISLIFGILATVYALTAVPQFRSLIVVTEATDNGAIGGAGGLMSQLGGLASLAGLNVNSNGPDADRPAFLQSRGLVDAFVRKYNLAPVINGNDKLNSVWFAVERFRKTVLDIHEEKIKGTTTITVEWRDPAVAARWASDFVALANDLMRERALQESTRNLEYLNKQLAQTNQVEIQQATYRLIEAETKNLMLAHGRLEYAFTIVDPPVPAEVRFSPRRTLIVISGLFIGAFFGSLIAWARAAIRRRRIPTTH
jgi:uncharacterized protein involved in exopolysaccharide biosynthesis